MFVHKQVFVNSYPKFKPVFIDAGIEIPIFDPE
jgi:hypothetical protein